MVEWGLPLLVENADISTSSHQQGGYGAASQATGNMEGSVPREVTAVQVAVSLWGWGGMGVS